ncbi:MAG: MmgE/PrpD family protein [Betaproteobacteria bacterium]|nr:MmgE/PrpD family protein [Betaproteobacteria bacterium]
MAEFAVGLNYDRIPPKVLERAKDCLIDTVGACVFGAELPWSRIVIGYAQRNSAPGECSVLGTDIKVRAPFASLCNGALAHAFELDCLCQPSVGVHPGASLVVPGLAVSQGRKKSGKDLITAMVAGYEVLYRIGDAGRHSSEKLGFHAPGLTGVFGGAVVVGRLMGLDAKGMANALGIAGSLCSGLLEFSRSGGGMVKRLHLGRAAEGGFMAAVLARDGYTGPDSVLEGKFGFLNAFCRDAEPDRLTRALGAEWHALKTTIKRYACHITAHVPVTLALELKARHGLSGDDVAQVRIAGGEKMVSHHAINDPQDLAMAQYSTPFCTALALYLDPMDPRSFSEASLKDPKIRALAKSARVELRKAAPGDTALASRVTLNLKDGREVSVEAQDFKGMPAKPLTREELREKFLKLVAHRDRAKAERLFAQLAEVEKVEDFSTLDFAL